MGLAMNLCVFPLRYPAGGTARKRAKKSVPTVSLFLHIFRPGLIPYISGPARHAEFAVRPQKRYDYNVQPNTSYSYPERPEGIDPMTARQPACSARCQFQQERS